MEQVTKISIHSLKIHPRNTEFFDDIEGEMYEQFKQSIKEDGVLTPIIVAPDMTIISGHQRYLACKDLEIELIPAIIREELVDEDLKLRQLIASNFGRLSNNPSKFRKAVKEYVDLVGLKDGQRKDFIGRQGLPTLTQQQIAEQLGVSERDLRNLLSIERNLIPELKESLDKGFISKTSALAICSKLDKSEQGELLTELTKLIGAKADENPDKDKISITNKEVDQLSQKIKDLQETNQKLVEKNTELMNTQYEKQQLKDKINELNFRLENVKPQDKPETLEKLRILKERETILKEKIELIEKDAEKYKQLKYQIESLTKKKDDIGRQIQSATELSGYIHEIDSFLKNKLAPIQYSRSLLEAKDNPVVIKNVKDIVETVENWCIDMRKYLPNEQQNVINIDSENIKEVF